MLHVGATHFSYFFFGDNVWTLIQSSLTIEHLLHVTTPNFPRWIVGIFQNAHPPFPRDTWKILIGFHGEKILWDFIHNKVHGLWLYIPHFFFQFSPYQTREFGLEINGHDQFHFPEISLCACSTSESYLNAK
jgi:hypothetical protein